MHILLFNILYCPKPKYFPHSLIPASMIDCYVLYLCRCTTNPRGSPEQGIQLRIVVRMARY